jgi:hypothetical protein
MIGRIGWNAAVIALAGTFSLVSAARAERAQPAEKAVPPVSGPALSPPSSPDSGPPVVRLAQFGIPYGGMGGFRGFGGQWGYGGRRGGLRGYGQNNRRQNPTGGKQGGSGQTSGAKKKLPGDPYAPADLATDVDALKQRHPAAVTKLPALMRSMDKNALALVEQLPLLAQDAYLLSVENYPTLQPDEKGQVETVMRALSELPTADQPRFKEAAAKTFTTLTSDTKQLAAARKTPVATASRLKSTIDQLKAAP